MKLVRAGSKMPKRSIIVSQRTCALNKTLQREQHSKQQLLVVLIGRLFAGKVLCASFSPVNRQPRQTHLVVQTRPRLAKNVDGKDRAHAQL